MNFEQAIAEIKQRWRDFYPADGKHKGIVCPICGSGSGPNGSGITEDPHHPGQLRCWNSAGHGERTRGRAFDVIDLYAEEHNTTTAEAVKEMAAQLGIEIDGKAEPIKKKPQAAPIQAAPREQSAYIMECVGRIAEPAAAAYLAKRGISLETAAPYFIGYDPQWISPTVKQNQQAKGNSWLPPTTPRLIIPSITEDAQCYHYVARDIRDSIPESEKRHQKMNEGSADLFNAAVLYWDGPADIWITEAAIDALSLLEIGKTAMGLNSTSNVHKLLKKLEQNPPQDKRFIVMLDNDPAGIENAKVLKDGLQRMNLEYINAAPVVYAACKGKDANELLTADRQAFIDAVEKCTLNIDSNNAADYIRYAMQADVERLKAGKDIKTGFSNIDKETGGLYGGLYVVGAISSLGKTTFCHQMADQLAAAGQQVIYFSLEQSRLELVSKSIARGIAEASDLAEDVTSLDIRYGWYPPCAQQAMQQYVNGAARNLNIVEGNFNCNVSYIADYVRDFIRKRKCKPIVFIDYLQILQGQDTSARASVKDVVDHTMTELKRLSREQEITIIVISSINRANYLTPIDFESFKESGGIEYTADVIWGLQLQCLNDDIFLSAKATIKEKRDLVRAEKAAEPRHIELVSLKNRYGRVDMHCYFDYYPRQDLFIEAQPEMQYCKAEQRRGVKAI